MTANEHNAAIQEVLRKLDDVADVMRAISTASKLVVEKMASMQDELLAMFDQQEEGE
jgi:hypothetical protein